MFTEEDSTTITNEDKKISNKKNSAFLKIVAKTFEAGDFLNIFVRFWAFRGSFSYKKFSYKKKYVMNFKSVSVYEFNFLNLLQKSIFCQIYNHGIL